MQEQHPAAEAGPAGRYAGTIYEPFDVCLEGTQVLVVHVDPDVAGSPILQDRATYAQMRALSDAAETAFRAELADTWSFDRLRPEGFLIFALGTDLSSAEVETGWTDLQRSLRQKMERVLDTLYEKNGLALHVVVSSLYPAAGNVYDAYAEALSIADHFLFFNRESRIVFSEEFRTGLSAAEIAAKERLEEQWNSCCAARDYVSAELVLLQILDMRASAPRLVISLKQELISRLECCIFRLCDSRHIRQEKYERLLRETDQLHSAKSLADLHRMVHAVMESLQDMAAGSGSSEQLDLVDRITMYVKSHYNEALLNAASIGRHFGLNQSYVSHVFAQQTGMGLLDYIHTTRIAHAKRLLQNTDFSMREIAERTGYCDASGFGRVFRRYTGTTPSAWRRASREIV